MSDNPTPDQLRAEAERLKARATELETQVTRAELASMSAEQIVEAKTDGRLNEVLGIAATPMPSKPTREDLQRLSDEGRHEEVIAADRAGNLDHLRKAPTTQAKDRP